MYRGSWVEVLKCFDVLLSATIFSASCQFGFPYMERKTAGKQTERKWKLHGQICQLHPVGMTSCPAAA